MRASDAVDGTGFMPSDRSHVVLKNAESKGGVWLVRTSTDRDECEAAIFEELDWTAVRLEGGRGSLLGQDAIDMRFEYRCFVVDGQVITAAGCIEEFTPLNTDRARTGTPFSALLRERRGTLGAERSEVVSRPDIAERLLAFARMVAARHGGTVTIDVALDAARDVPVVVELNELSNSDLYASDPWAIAQVLQGARDRGYRSVP